MQGHFTDIQLSQILSNPSYINANKIILDCLIEKFKTSNVLYLCDQLEKLIPLSLDPTELFKIINEIRSKFLCIHLGTYVTRFAKTNLVRTK